MTFPTPKGFDESQFKTDEQEPEPEPESNQEPTFPDDMSREELKEAIETYQEWVAENYPVDIDLSEIPVDISDRLTKTAGKVNWIKGSNVVNYIRYAYKAYQSWGWDQFTETIRHELIHVHTVQNYHKGGHGRLFKLLVDPLDTHLHCKTFAEDDAKYVLHCSDCDKIVAYRYRKSKSVKRPEKYQSKCCGAGLRVESN